MKRIQHLPLLYCTKGRKLKCKLRKWCCTIKCLFEVYDEMPVVESEYGTYTKRQDVNYLFAAYTQEDGTYQGKLELPSYLTKVYIYSPAFFAQTLMEANVVDGSIEAIDNTSTDTRTITNTSTPYDSYLVSNRYGNEVWKTWLGPYNLYKTGILIISTREN